MSVVNDDANGCAGTSSCSSSGSCLEIDQQMPQASNYRSYDILSRQHAQVISFDSAGQLVEMRADFACADAMQPNAFIDSVKNDAPSGTHLSRITVYYDSARPNTGLNALRLDPPLAVRPGDRVALVMSAPGTLKCLVAFNLERPYPGGACLSYSDEGWRTSEYGSLIFQTLVKR